MDFEIQNIIRESELNSKFEELNYKFLTLLNKKPEGIIWENFDDGQLLKFIDKAINYEFYELVKIFKDEQEKRLITKK